MIDRLIDSLQSLAASPAKDVRDREQVAGDFADALLLVTDCPQLQLAPHQRSALEAVGALLDMDSGVGVAATPQGDEVRAAARAALASLEQPLADRPDG